MMNIALAFTLLLVTGNMKAKADVDADNMTVKTDLITMAQQCLAMRINTDACNQQVMSKCKEESNQTDCSKMMSQVKEGARSL